MNQSVKESSYENNPLCKRKSVRFDLYKRKAWIEMEKIDEIIKEELELRADQFVFPDDMTERISLRLNDDQKENEFKMIKVKKKKMVLLVACAVLVLGCVSMAAGKVAGISSSSRSIPTYTKYEDLSKAENKIGVASYAPENFDNGFVFTGIYDSHEKRLDEQDQALAEYDALEIEYKKDKERVLLEVDPYDWSNDCEEDSIEKLVINDRTCYIYEYANLFVPPNYEPTEEELTAMEEGRLNIGYGADEISTSTSISICWCEDGNMHQLFYMSENPVLTRDDMVQMAEKCMK